MKKLTRRSYNRKLVIFGLALFMAFGMISTGFAAWVMSTASNATANPNVTVDTITDEGFVVTIDQVDDEGAWIGSELSFDALKTDASGRVYYQSDNMGVDEEDNPVDNDKGEVKQMKISGSVDNANALNTLTMEIDLPDQFVTAQKMGLIEIVLPDGVTMDAEGKFTLTWTKGGVYTNTLSDVTFNTSDSNVIEFSFTLTYKWGSFFAGMNPSEFYDDDETAADKRIAKLNAEGTALEGPVAEFDAGNGKGISDDQMKKEMHAFRALMTENAETTATYTGTIAIVVTASH